MVKPDFPALLEPGIHTISTSELQQLSVTPFPEDGRRKALFENLCKWLHALQASGVQGVLWLDGSFLTTKPTPGDIDCVLWNPSWTDPEQTTAEDERLVEELLDVANARALYGLDFYLETPSPDMMFHRESYWRGLLGFAHDGVTAKGFAAIPL